MLFQPRAWRQWVHRVGPGLAADFTLIDLTRVGMAYPQPMLGLVGRAFFLYPLYTAIAIGVGLMLVGDGAGSPLPVFIHALSWQWTLLIILALVVSFPAALAVSLVGGLLAAFPLGERDFATMMAGAMFVLGLAGSVLWHLATSRDLPILQKLLVALATAVGWTLLPWFLFLLLSLGWLGDGLIAERLDHAQAMWVILIAVAGGLLGILNHSPLFAFLLALGLPLPLFAAFYFEGESLPHAWNFLIGASQAVVVAVIFALPQQVAKTLGGGRSGVIAGSLLLVIVYEVLCELNHPGDWSRMVGGPLLLLLGLTQSLWRPILLYPLVEMWNFTLFRLDEANRSTNHTRSPAEMWYAYHSVHWDEFQPLPLTSLESYYRLLRQLPRQRTEPWLKRLDESPQRWVLEGYQRDHALAQLEQATTVEKIAAVHEGLEMNFTDTAESALARQLSRISRDIAVALQQSTRHGQRLMLGEVEERLSHLLISQPTKTTAYTMRRLYGIVAQWRACLEDALRIWRDDSDREIDNPYVVGVPLTAKQDIFVGRQAIGARLERLLVEHHCPPIMLYGQRRIGKTSLLNNLSRLMSSRLIFVYVDFQSPRVLGGEVPGILYALAQAIATAVRRTLRVDYPKPESRQFEGNPFVLFEEWLQDLESRLQGHTLLVTLDEFVVLEELRVRGRMSEADVYGLLSLFRHLIQHRPSFRLLLAGSYTIEELGQWAGHLNNVQVEPVGLLSEAEARQLIEAPTPNFSLLYTKEARDRVLALTQGHPALTQLLCSEIVELKNAQTILHRRLAETEDVNNALIRALTSGSFFFQDIVKNQVSASDLEVLIAIAAHDPPPVSEKILRERFGSRVEIAKEALLRRELIKENEQGLYVGVEMVRLGILMMT